MYACIRKDKSIYLTPNVSKFIEKVVNTRVKGFLLQFKELLSFSPKLTQDQKVVGPEDWRMASTLHIYTLETLVFFPIVPGVHTY
jgi:hypothetical protein